MIISLDEIAATAEKALPIPEATAQNCAWLESCGYPGIRLLLEAKADSGRELPLTRDALGIDLQDVSCVFLGPAVAKEVQRNGRAFLRNVRHGLYLLPLSVELNIGIGCPIDPAFALGGERHRNTYAEKVEAARTHGVDIADDLWHALQSASVQET